ncbi:MAG: hypothetical protein Q9208_004138 [Pyrenodesmia sp. 3 TL-2023]
MAATKTLFPIFNLPSELRAHILSFLLPDVNPIQCDTHWSPTAEGPPRGCCPVTWEAGEGLSEYTFRSDGEPCQMAILRTCRCLFDDGMKQLYACKTYKAHVFDYGIDFLTEAGQLRALPQMPYRRMKEFVIQIMGCDMAETGDRLRANLVWLCGQLKQNNVRLSKLRIEFDLPLLWEKAWDQTEAEDPQPPIVDPRAINAYNADLAAWECGFYSTFAYILSALPMLPLVDECVIDVPERLREKQHVVDLARWYEEGIDGTYAFDEDNWIFQQDKEDFARRLKLDGRWRDCDCADCIAHFDRIEWSHKERREHKERVKETNKRRHDQANEFEVPENGWPIPSEAPASFGGEW